MIQPERFIEDFRSLYRQSPQCGSWTRASENCDYGDTITVSKDCYLCFNSGNCRDAYYCEDSRALTDCTDCAFCEDCTLCYECVDCANCYDSNFSQDCSNCEDVHFSYDLRRCQHCIGCVGLRDKQYYIFNKPHTPEEYQNALATLDMSHQESLRIIGKKLEELKRERPRLFSHQFDTQDSSGDYLTHTKNCHHCFDTRHTEDSGYIIQANLDTGTRDSWDCGPVPTGMDLCYDVCHSHYLFNCKHLYWCGNLKDCQFTMNCFESKNLFGCHYLKNKEDGFYILNQKVEEQEYRDIVPKILRELERKGIYTLHDLLFKGPAAPPKVVPDSEFRRECQLCQGAFEIVDAERKFYQKMDIRFPVYCPTCRGKQRTDLRAERKMYKRTCDGCKNPLITLYPAETKGLVYCLDCYWKNIG